MFEPLLVEIKAAKKIIVSTHRHCDGDGLGAELAVFHALRSLGKDVRMVNVDRPARKYHFLQAGAPLEVYDPASHDGSRSFEADLALIFDTNDSRLVEPLFTGLVRNCKKIAFVDHHPALKIGPQPTPLSWLDTTSASTGEMAFRLINELGVALTPEIARALYTSLVFDTQLFRYVKSDPRSHTMAAALLRVEKNPEQIHRALFATYTVAKMRFLAQALTRVSYLCDDRIAFLSVDGTEAALVGLEADETGDIIDQVMNIESVDVAALVRKDSGGWFKISLRSKGRITVLPLAELLGGGGHPFAAGATTNLPFDVVKQKLIEALTEALTAALSGGENPGSASA